MEKRKEFYIVAYDIKSNKRRSRVSKLLARYGVRVNYSVFECMFTAGQLRFVRNRVMILINKKQDSVIFYPCCLDCFSKIEYLPPDNRRAPAPMVILG